MGSRECKVPWSVGVGFGGSFVADMLPLTASSTARVGAVQCVGTKNRTTKFGLAQAMLAVLRRENVQ